MPKKLNIRQAVAKKITITASDQTLTLKFPFTTSFARAIGWYEELPDATGTWSPDAPHNKVEVRTIEFIPTDPSQASRAIQLECHGHMENFTVVRKAAKGKDAKRAALKSTHVTCTVAFADENGAGMLTAYMRAVPFSNLVVSYDPSPVQKPLPGAETEQPDPDQFEIPTGTITTSDETEDVGRYVAKDEPEAPEQSDDTTEAPAGDPAAPVKRGRGRPRKNPVA